jgi:hypothetical protein
MRSVTVYGLREKGKDVRYIGQTVKPLSRRLTEHYVAANKFHCRLQKWIRSVVARKCEIEIYPIVENAILHETERMVISEHRKKGIDLVNLTDGGEGTKNFVISDEHRKIVGEANRKRIFTEEDRKNISLRHKGRKHSLETKNKISSALKNSDKYKIAKK